VKFKYNGGEPITREFFDEHISGGHNILLGKFLWPDWSQKARDDFADEKEALFREYSRESLSLHHIQGLTSSVCMVVSVCRLQESPCLVSFLQATSA
jgi:hypothetical protein